MTSPASFEDAVTASLQAGGRYSNISLTMMGGMMAAKARTLHFSAKETASGSALHIKVTPARGQSATLELAELAGQDRLIRLTERIRAIEKDRKALNLPIVEVLDAVMLTTPAAQATVMRSVRCVRDVLAASLDLGLAIRVLQQLCATRLCGWIHFDICPSNTGLDDKGNPLLIDLDSVYMPTGGYQAISTAVCKSERMSAALLASIRRDTANPDVLLKKHDDDIILLAAECCLGLLGARFDKANVDEWIDNSSASLRVRELWLPILMDLADGIGRPPLEVARQLESLLSRPTADKSNEAPSLDTITTWNGFSKWSQLLRKELLSVEQIDAYRKRLLEVGVDAATPEIWRESTYVSLVYQKDVAMTKSILREALKKHPDDAELRERSEQTKVWPDDHD